MSFRRRCMARASVRAAVLFALSLVAAVPAFAVTNQWTGSGNWSNTSNWGLGHVPTASEDVEIGTLQTSGACVVDVNASINSFTMSDQYLNSQTLTINNGVTLTIANTSTVGSTASGTNKLIMNGSATLTGGGNLVFGSTGSWDWNGGVVSGAGSISIGSGAIVNVGASSYPYLARTISNSGTINYSATSTYWTFQTGGIVNNTGSFILQSDAQIYGSGSGFAINNNAGGTLSKSSGTTSIINIPVNNAGTITASVGDITLNGGGASTGAFTTASTTTITIANNSAAYTLNTGATVGGSGKLIISTGRLTVPTGVSVTIPKLQLSTANAFLDGAGTVTISTSLDWFGGQMQGGGTTLVDTGATATLNGDSGPAYLYLNPRSLVIKGTANYSSATYGLYLYSTSTLNVNAAATFNIQTDLGVYVSGSGNTIVNAGTIQKTTGSGTSTLDPTITNNAGTISVTAGRLQLNGGGTFNGGTLNTGTTSSIDFGTSGNLTYIASAVTITGTGNYRMTGGDLKIGTGVTQTLPSLELLHNASEVYGTGTLNLTGTSTWAAGNLGSTSDPGTSIVIPNGATMNMTGATNYMYLVSTAVLTNNGTINYAPVNALYLYNTSSFVNNGTFTITNDADISYSGTPAITNNGTFEKTAGSGVTIIYAPFANSATGTLNAATGTIQLHGGGSNAGAFASSSGATILLSSTYTFASTANLSGSAGTFELTNSGRLTVAAGNVTIANLKMTGGILDGAGTVTLTGAADWQSGNMGYYLATGGTTILDTGATLLISASNYVYLDQSRTLTNNGTITYTPAYSLYIQNGATLNNASTLNITGDYNMFSGGTLAQINNSGSINKTGGTGASTLSVVINNSGLISATSGKLVLNGNAGTNTHTGGTFTATSPGTIEFGNGTHTLDAASSIGGTGTARFSNATVTMAGTFSPSATEIAPSGTFTLNSNGSTGTFTMTGGTLGGTGTLTINSNSTWSGGTMTGSGATTLAAGKTLTIDGAVGYTSVDGGRTFNNNGTILYTAPTYHFGIFNNSTLENAGTFDIQTDQLIYGYTNGRLHNQSGATLTKSVGSGTTVIHAIVDNDGTMTATTGTVSMIGGGTHTGTFNPTTPATIGFGGNTHTLSGSGSLTGTGTIAFTGGTTTVGVAFNPATIDISGSTIATFNANGTVGTLNFATGTLGGTGTFDITQGATWSGGTMTGTGTTTLAAGKTMSMPDNSYKTLDNSRTFVNNGTINYSAANYYLTLYNNVTFTNAGTLNIQTDADINGYTTSVINNSGSINKTAGVDTTLVYPVVNNSGSVTVTAGTLMFNGGGTHTGSFSATTPGTVAFGNGTHNVSGAGSLGGTGTIAFTGGTTNVSNSYNPTTISISGGTANFNSSGSAGTLNMSGGTLGGTGTFSIVNGATWSGGTMQDAGTTILPAGKTMTISGATSYTALDGGRTLQNNGTIVYSTPAYYLGIYTNAVLNNAGLFNIQTDTQIYGYNTAAFNNSGTLTKTAGTGTCSFNPPMNNSGSVNVTSGTLAFAGGGTDTGSYSITSPGAIAFTGGARSMTGAGTFSGTGAASISGGTTTIGIPYSVASTTITAGTVNFDNTASTSAFSFTNGTLGGTGTLTLTNGGTWNGGGMTGSGTTIVPVGKTLTIGNNSYTGLDNGRTLQNNGNIVYSAPSYYLQIYNNATLNNAGTFSAQNALPIYGYNNGTFNNTGTFTKSVAGTSAVSAVFNNSGTTNVTNGTLELSATSTHSGSFNVTSPGVLSFTGGTQTLTASSTITGAGVVRIAGGTVNVAGNYNGMPVELTSGTVNLSSAGTIPSLTQSGGLLGGTAALTIATSATWSGGTMNGTGSTTFDTGCTVSMPGTTYTTAQRPIINKGTVTYSAANYYFQIDSNTFTNDGTFNYTGDALIYGYGTGEQFTNNGTFTRSTSTASSYFYGNFTNNGTAQFNSGTVQYTSNYLQAAGSTLVGSGAVLKVPTLQNNGGTVGGSGTIDGNLANGAIVAPGASPAALTITGNYTQAATGSLNVELGGTTAGTQYDQLLVAGTATLDGALNVSTINSFTPVTGNTFQILTFASRSGDFAAKNGLSLGGGTNLIPAYSASDLQLATNTVQSDLFVTAGYSPATIANGNTFSYNMTITNGAGANATNVVLSGTLPANVNLLTATASQGTCSGNPAVSCSIGSMAAGGTATVTITVQTTASGPASFTASVTGSEFDPNTSNNSATTNPVIGASANLSVTLADTPDPVAASGNVTYTVNYANAGPDTATSLSLTLAISGGSIQSFSGAGWGCNLGATSRTCTLASLASGASGSITFTATAPSSAGALNANVSLTSSTPDPNGANNTAAATTTVQGTDVSIVKSGPSSVPAGGSAVFTIVVTNSGTTSAANVTVTDTASAGLTFASNSGACATAFPCSLGTLAAGQSATITSTFTVAANAAGTLTNTASVSTSSSDTNAGNNTSTASTAVQTVDLSIVKTGPGTGTAGGTATFTIVVTNNGTGPAASVTVSDAPQSGLTFASNSGACTTAFPCSLGTLASGQSVTITSTFNIAPNASGTLSNTAGVSTTATDTNNANNSSSANISINAPCPTAPQLVSPSSLQQNVPVSGFLKWNAVPGATSYNVYVGPFGSGCSTLAGNTSATQFAYSNLQPGQKYEWRVEALATSCTPAPSVCDYFYAECPTPAITADTSVTAGSTGNSAFTQARNGATYNWSISNGTITSGQGTSSITYTAGNSGSVTLGVTVTTGICNASGSINVPIGTQQTPDADLTISKSAPASLDPGAPFAYTLVVTNNSSSAAENVVVADALPAGVTFNSVSAAGWNCTGGATITCSATTIFNGAASPIVINVTAPQQGTFTNTASVSASTNDPNNANNSDSATTSITTQQPPLCPDTAPAQLSPANGATNLSSPVTFTWTAVSNATSYDVWIKPNGGAPALVGSTGSTSLSAAVPSGSIDWYVVARGGDQCEPRLSATRSFTVAQATNCNEHGAASLVAPAANATVTSPVTFQWTAVNGAIGYTVYVKVGDDAAQDVGSTDGATTLTANVPAGTITWYVDAIFAGCPPTTSNSSVFIVPKTNPCENRGTATLIAPANDSTSQTAQIEFRWSPVNNAAGYRVWIAVGNGTPQVVGTTNDTTLKETIPTGTIHWWVETLFEGCASTESQHFTFTIPQQQNCGSEKASLISPSEGATLTDANVTFSWSPVAKALSYEVWLSLGSGTPTLIATTDGATTSVTKQVGEGQIDWFVRAVFDGCPSRDSQSGRFTLQLPASCDNNERPILKAPAEGEQVGSPVEFRWSAVEGATKYELYVAKGNTAYTRFAETDEPHADDVSIANGAARWYVRAYFGAGCPPLDTTESRFVVIPPVAACSPLDAPTVAAPAQISSNATAAIQWSFVPGATSYVVQISATPDFPQNATENIPIVAPREYAFTLANHGTSPLTRYVRVRALDEKCAKPNASPYSQASVIFILPDSTGEGSGLASETNSLQYALPLGAELAGQTFTATATQPWITVSPDHGVVPVGGTSLIVNVDARGLSAGTSIGGVTITTTSSSGRYATQDTKTKTTPVTINLVSPVTPTPKSTPPPDALIIPAVAHADGVNSHFQSDVRVTNTSAQVIKYQVTFTPSGDAGIAEGKRTTMEIEPGKTVALDDVLRTWFASGASTNATGTLEVRPLTDTAKTTSAAATSGLANLVSFAASRTFNLAANGTFGQYIPAIPYANFIGASSKSTLMLQQISQSQQYRTNLGLVEGSGEPVNLLVSVYGSAGKLTEFPVALKGGQHTQLNSFLTQQGVEVNDGRIEVKVVSGSGKITAYASVLDNGTSDPLLVAPVTLGEQGLTKWVLPGVADLSNGLANWRTDMRLFNGGTEAAETTLSFYSQNGGEPKTAKITLAPGEIKQLDSTLSSVFGVTGDGGAVHITTAAGARLIATARTFNQTPNGTFGQFISAVTPAEAVGLGQRPLQLLQVEESDRFRSNVGIAEVSGKPARAEITIIPPDSKISAKLMVDLAPNQFRQFNSLLRGYLTGDTYNARVTVRVVEGEGRIAAYASVVDMQTQDPTYVPAQ